MPLQAIGSLPALSDDKIVLVQGALPHLENEIEPYDLGLAHFALFRALRRRGRFQEAWGHLSTANRLHDLGVPDSDLELDLQVGQLGCYYVGRIVFGATCPHKSHHG